MDVIHKGSLPALAAISIILISCGHAQRSSEAGASSPSPADYNPRVGVAVRTAARACLAIHNSTLAAGSPVTLVITTEPQSFVTATVKAQTQQPCPIANSPDVSLSSYDLDADPNQVPKLVPLIVVTGAPAPFQMQNTDVQADLDQNGKQEKFRSCSADDGIHLTVWSGQPLSSTILWRGYYYESSNPGVGPACTPAETAAPPA